MDSQATPQPVMCEVCGTYFETRRGLSSHARLHLRQLGVTLSENSGAPIELLYQLIQERDGCLPVFKSASSVFGPTPDTKTSQLESNTPLVQDDSNTSYGTPVRIMATSQKVDHQGSPARLKESATSILPSSPSSLRLSESSNSSFVEQQITTKPLWAPLETDAPITLDTNEEVHVCQLCGAWFETRKGLASHARVHLRQIGVSDSEVKGSPVDFLYKIMEEEELKPLTAQQELTSIRSSSKRSAEVRSPAASPPSKRPKAAAAAAAPAFPESPAPSQPHPLFSSTPLNLSPMSPPANKAPKAKKGFRLAVDPLFKKPKPEPVEMELSDPPKALSSDASSPLQKSPAAVVPANPLRSGTPSPPTVLCDYCGQLFDTRKALSCHARAHLRQLGLSWSIRTSPIDLLKEVMEQGKHVNQESAPAPKKPQGSLSSAEPAPNPCASPVDFSVKEKPPYNKSGSSHADTSCELCGFDFENRKALASHARAHLRQLGLIEWKADGATSPIELLSELIRKDPARVSEITKRYRVGDLYIKRAQRHAGSPSLSTDSDSVNSGSLRQHDHRAIRDTSGTTASSSRHSQGYARTMTAHSNPNVRSPRGLHPPKHSSPGGTVHHYTSSQQPPRSGSIPALLPKPPLTPLVKLVGKMYTLKCRFCEEVFHGPLSVQEQWIVHLQKHILSLGYKGKESPPAAPVTAPALVDPVAV